MATAAAAPRTEDQNDRLLRSLQASPIVAQPTAAPDGGADVFASLLLGLAGGLVGAAAAIAGWTATARRRPHHAAA